MSLCTLLRTASRTHAAKVAVYHAADEITYGELAIRAEDLASRIRDVTAAFDPRVPVAVCMERGIPMVVALLGVLFSGRPYVPVDPRLPEKRKEYIVEDSLAPAMVSDEPQPWTEIPTMKSMETDAHHVVNGATTIRGDGAVVTPVNDAKVADINAACPPAVSSTALVRSDRPSSAYVIYTSGSTGKPKGVEVSQDNVVRVLAAFDALLDDREEFVALTTIAFDISALEIFWPLTRGRRLRVADHVWNVPLHPKAVLQATPSTFQVLLENQDLHGAVILVGGEALPLGLAKRLASKSPRVTNCYGPTEATIWASTHAIRDLKNVTRVSIGRPIAGSEFKLGPENELWIRGNLNSYWRREELNAVAFEDEWYRTGDICEQCDGDFYFLGRLDAQVKLLGHRIELGEIESVLDDMAGVSQSAAVIHANALTLFVGADHRVEEPEVLSRLRAWLPHYMVPRHVRILPQLPVTDNDKIDRRALLDMIAPKANGEAVLSKSKGRSREKVALKERVTELFLDYSGLPEDGPFSIDSLAAVAFLQSLPLRGMPKSWHPINDGIPLLFAAQQTGLHTFIDSLRALGAEDVCATKATNTKDATKPHKNTHPRRNPLVVDASRDGNLETLSRLTDAELHEVDRFGSSGMHWAASSGHLEVCKYLRGRGLSTTYADKKSGRQTLHWAARQGRMHILEWLDTHGPLEVDMLTFDRTTPLQLAAWGGFEEVADWLLVRGANMDHVNQWACTIVHFASLSGQVGMCKYLHAQGVLLGQTNSQGHHALHKAAYGGHADLCRWLRDSLHLSITDEDARGQTPSKLAIKAGFWELGRELDPSSES
eukprot:GEMP01006537.1.p1 GENE.GEMP01006537.1~~GEMP01006537.1.p1  ORF type:complete len:828 (+),score=205.05 GEMP01006537.1:324-2807(+)